MRKKIFGKYSVLTFIFKIKDRFVVEHLPEANIPYNIFLVEEEEEENRDCRKETLSMENADKVRMHFTRGQD